MIKKIALGIVVAAALLVPAASQAQGYWLGPPPPGPWGYHHYWGYPRPWGWAPPPPGYWCPRCVERVRYDWRGYRHVWRRCY